MKGQKGRFEKHILEVIIEAKRKDVYLFTKIKAACPGDKIPRKLNNVCFIIRQRTFLG
jgi:hypothetical protein